MVTTSTTSTSSANTRVLKNTLDIQENFLGRDEQLGDVSTESRSNRWIRHPTKRELAKDKLVVKIQSKGSELELQPNPRIERHE